MKWCTPVTIHVTVIILWVKVDLALKFWLSIIIQQEILLALIWNYFIYPSMICLGYVPPPDTLDPVVHDGFDEVGELVLKSL